jgi:hypothetical protein
MISAEQAAVGTAATMVVAVPPGPCTVLLSNTSAGPVFIGGTGVTSANGYGIPAGAQVDITGWPGSRGQNLYAVGSAATTLGVLTITSG